MEQYGGSLPDNTLKSVLKIESRLCNCNLSIDTLMKNHLKVANLIFEFHLHDYTWILSAIF